MTKMTAVGVTCGIGSLLIGARQAGFKVLGNIEWRKYYHAKDEEGRNTFSSNFPGAIFPHSLDNLPLEEIEKLMGADIALGHPECGHFSLLNSMNNRDLVNDPADIPLFVDMIAKLKPRYFVMDDLPDSFVAFPMVEYASRLKQYDLFPEQISNWGYGNVQRQRNRMFMIGSLKKERWTFVPGEQEHNKTIKDVIGDIGHGRLGEQSNLPNHDPHDMDAICSRARHLETLGRGVEGTYWDLANYLIAPGRPRSRNAQYVKEDGTLSDRPGNLANRWDGPSGVLCGNAIKAHPLYGRPYTIRERARIQGFPDDFIFYGTKLDKKGRWRHEQNINLVKQTGKAMPVQFAKYVSQQIAAHIKGRSWAASGKRVINTHPRISEAKKWFCGNVGYSNQQKVCEMCWQSEDCEIRKQKRIKLG